jgi:radical SAM superfamily enzyme YgiQ (UPF0313 family)
MTVRAGRRGQKPLWIERHEGRASPSQSNESSARPNTAYHRQNMRQQHFAAMLKRTTHITESGFAHLPGLPVYTERVDLGSESLFFSDLEVTPICAMDKTVVLVSPLSKSLVGKGFYFRMPAFGLLKLASLTPRSWKVSIVDEKVESLDLNVEPDLVGISAMTATAGRAYELGDHFRKRGVKVVMGGMHVSSVPDEALRHCDSVVVGEAEGLWPKLLADCEAGQLQPVYRHSDGYPSLEGLPYPDWDAFENKHYLPVHFVETTRGCPWDCEFCAVSNAFGGTYRSRPYEEVLGELRNRKPFQGRFQLPNCVFFIDDNIISNRRYARDLFERVADLRIHWFSHASVNIASDPEMLKLCKSSGCEGLLIGFETLSSETMSSIGHKPNRPAKYYDIVDRIHDAGIGIDAAFVFGFDTDDEGVFDRTLEFIHKAKIEIPYFSILTPYPGTRLYQRMVEARRLLTTDWALYDTSHVVYEPKALTPEKLLAGYLRVLKESFTWRSMVQRLWGTTSWKPFFYGMNFGYRQSVKSMLRNFEGNGRPAVSPGDSAEVVCAAGDTPGNGARI